MNLKKLKGLFDSQTKILFKNSSWVLGSNIFRAVLLFIRGIIVARGLGAELFGTFNIIASFAGIIHQLLSFPIGYTIIKYGADYLTDKNYRKFAALLKGGILVSIGLAVVSILVIGGLTLFVYDIFLEDPDLETFVIFYAIIASTVFFDELSRSLLRLLFKFKENGFVIIAVAIIDILIISSVIYFNPDNFAFFFGAILISKLIASLLLNGVTFVYFKNIVQPYWRVPVKILKNESKEIYNFTIGNFGSKIVKALINNGDVLLLGALAGPVPVAFYNIAKKLAKSIMIVIDPLKTTIFPQLSSLISRKKYSEVAIMIRKTTGMILLPSLLIVFIFYWFRKDIILYTYGSEYIQAAAPFVFQAIGAIMAAVFYWNVSLLLSLGKVKFRLYISIVALLIGGAYAFIMTPYQGATGTAIGLLIANTIITISFSVFSYSKIINRKESL